ncbi:hypothetical protein RHS01_10150 [Rhizoctonia solani]|uniref:Protein kinase domain-containing protein n=1 Tax=Rhizoctonia solani TaxID=456999 RepID=A0A8H7M0V3_9AGAM|nr:hypothetical protein RHS01_10150 [Rhizoctonia solani]
MYTLRLLRSGDDPVQDTIKIELENLSDTDVHDLKVRYVRLRSLASPVGLRLYKIDIPPKEFKHANLQLTDSNILENNEFLDRYWPNDVPRVINVLVVSADTGQVQSRNELNNTSNDFRALEGLQEKMFRHLRLSNSSSWAQISNFSNLQGAPDVAILNGRPVQRIGLPVGLYHPVFDKFVSSLSANISVPTGEIPQTFYDKMKELLGASQDMYEREIGRDGRDRKICLALSGLIEHDMPSVDRSGTKPDGVVSGVDGEICMVIEVKNEIGVGGSDPTIQGAISYAQLWGDDMMKSKRCWTCCPSFILGIAGPWMCVLGAVILSQPVVQPLTDFIWVGINPRSELHFRRLGRFFWAMKNAIADLKDYYSSVPAEILISRFYPYIRQYSVANETVEFTYVKQLGNPRSLKTVFLARTKSQHGSPSKDIVVKFVETYHGVAHRLLSEAHLAPKLLFDGSTDTSAPRPSGCMMIIMEYVNVQDLSEIDCPVPYSVRSSIKEAIRILHNHNIVFGDLRRPNVLAYKDEHGSYQGMLVDFDWCGTHGQSRYPETINRDVGWAKGVGGGQLMMKEHDEVMLGCIV